MSEQESVADLLARGIRAAQEKRVEEARECLLQVVEQDQWNEQAWLWLSGVMDDPRDMQVALANVLTINPESEYARKGLEFLRDRYGDLLASEEEAAAVSAGEATVGEEEDDDVLFCYSCGAELYTVAHFCWQCHAAVHCCANCVSLRDVECKQRNGIRGPAATFTANQCEEWVPQK